MFRRFRGHLPAVWILLGLAPAFGLAVLLAPQVACQMPYAAFEAQYGHLGIHRCPGDSLCRLIVRDEEVTAYLFQPGAAGGLCLARVQRRGTASIADIRDAAPQEP